MDINTISIGLLSIPLIYLAYLYYTQPKQIIPEKPRFLWGEQVGKTRPIQSKTGDASMATELTRRRAIQGSGRLDTSKLKESRTSAGSTTGAIETFFITSICPPLQLIYDIIFDGGDPNSEFCPILDGEDNGIVYDAGNVNTIVCGV